MGIYVTGPPLGATLVLALTSSVLMPYFGDDWRLVLRLWAWVGVLAALYWLVVATFCGRRAARAGQTTEVSGIGFSQLRELLSLREVQLVLLISIGAFMFNHGLYNWLPEMLRINGLTPVEAGYWATIPVVIGVVSALIVPRQAIPAHRITVLAGLFAIAGCAAVLLSVDLAAIRLLALVLQGIAGGTMMTVLMLTLVELKHVGPDKAGLAGGLFFSVAEIGGVGGPVMLGVLYDVTGTFHSGLYVLAILTIIMLILASRLRPFIEPTNH
jgi:cyanate permease